MNNVNEKLREYQAQHHATAEIASMSDAIDDVINVLRNGRSFAGDPLPWKKTEELFRLRPKELTVWAGYNGHGKTMVLSDIMAHSVTHNGAKWAVASLEMPLARLAERFVIQCAVSQKPTEQYVRECLTWTDERIFVFDELDSVEPDRILAFAQMAFDHLGVDHVVIDSLVKCGVDSEHNEPQKRFIDALQRVAKHHGGHVHLVHHLRKGMDEEKIPNKLDLKGAGEISDLADNVVIVHRNRRKEREMLDPAKAETAQHDPDARLVVDKQRNFEWTGSIRLWFDQNGLRYRGGEDGRLAWCGPSLREIRDAL